VGNYDFFYTKFGVPFYHFGVTMASNVVRIFYDIVICWWNLYQQVPLPPPTSWLTSPLQLLNILWQETVNTLFECTAVEWADISQTVVDLVEEPYDAMILFIASNGQDDVETEGFFRAVSAAIVSMFDIATCLCEDASLFYNWIAVSIQSDNLFCMLFHWSNVWPSLIREVGNFLVELFRQVRAPPYTANPSRILCSCRRRSPVRRTTR